MGNLLTIDTETCGGFGNPLMYDFSGIVHDRKGIEKTEFAFVIDEVFNGMEDKMKSAYYANKLPKYYEAIENGTREVVPLSYAKVYFDCICDEYDIEAIIAHNAKFDYKSTRNTANEVLNIESLLPNDIEIWDSMKMAKSTIAKTKKYRKWCEENGFMTKHKKPRPQTKAEVLYKYISGDMDFIESHTALEDARIEIAISASCFATKKKMKKALFE